MLKKVILYTIISFIVTLLPLIYLYIKENIGNNNKNIYLVGNYPVIHETKFGGIYIKITIADFNDLGYEFGDSVDIKFSNGYELLDLPYYNGFYVDINEPLLIGYPGYDYIKVAINYGEDLYIKANLTENDMATISLKEKAKYIKIQKAMDISYEIEQGNTPDAVFANFRNVKVGNIKENILYRSASPSDNAYNRAPVVDKLIKEAGINHIIDLSNKDEDLKNLVNKNDFNSPYFLTLYNANKVTALGMKMQFKKQDFKEKLVKGLTAIDDNSGPYLVHCVEGKDRTGYVMMLIEALLGASYQEIIDDYMETYKNYYGITKETDIDRYETLKEKNIDLMLNYINDDKNNEKDMSKIDDYSTLAKKYLLSIGMTEENINKIIKQLSE